MTTVYHQTKTWCNETTGPVEIKLGRNVHWMVLYKHFLIGNPQDEQQAQSVKKRFFCCSNQFLRARVAQWVR
jgi:hypothetical protein